MTTATSTAPASGPPVSGLPVAEGVARMHATLDEIGSAAVAGPVTGRDIAEVDRAIARLQSLKLRMVSSADRSHVATAAGMSGTAAWLAAHTRSGAAEAAGAVGLATALDDRLPATREALAAGELSPAHASVIAGTAERLPEDLTDEERARVEASLVAQARRLDPAKLRRAARRALEAAQRAAEEVARHEDAELRDEESRAEARVRLTMHDNQDGTVSGHFTVPALAGAVLRKVVQQLASPRRGRSGASGRDEAPGSAVNGADATQGADRAASPGTGSGAAVVGPRWPADVDWAHRHGMAFVELLEHLPTDKLHGKVAATVVVTVGLEALRADLGAAGLDTGHQVSAAQARRLACNAGVLPSILGGDSLPLDLGRTARFFSENQRVALASVYDECAAEGCDRPYAWSELHHEDPWVEDGRTDLHLAVPLCGWHHRRVHDPTFRHRITQTRGRKVVTLRRRC